VGGVGAGWRKWWPPPARHSPHPAPSPLTPHAPHSLAVAVLVQVLDAARVEGGAAAQDAIDDVALHEEELGEVGAILAGDALQERRRGGRSEGGVQLV